VNGEIDIAAVAALLAEPSRAELVLAVMDAGALTATALAARAGVTASTTSEHLTRLVNAGFLSSAKRGRHRYYELADPAVAAAVEALALVAPPKPVRSLRDATRAELLRAARTCYDHLAGAAGVALARVLERRRIVLRRDGTFVVGDGAAAGLAALEIDLEALARGRRPLVRGCLDWSERELHVAGAVGAAITQRLFERGCLERRAGNRSVALTASGRDFLERELGVELAPRSGAAGD
jgi:DNA-binding transcriptional ArsR family regulator